MGIFEEAQGVIFDCDGTLLDTMGVWDEVEEPIFAQIRKLTPDEEAELHAVAIEEAARLFHEKYGACSSTQEVLDMMDGRLMEEYRDHPKVLPGAIDLLKRLKELGIPCVVISSSPFRFIETGLVSSGLRSYFKEVITSDVYNLSKQDPRIYETACEIMGSTSDTTWAIDDAVYANAVLAELGYHTIAPLNGRDEETAAQLRALAEQVVDTLDELL